MTETNKCCANCVFYETYLTGKMVLDGKVESQDFKVEHGCFINSADLSHLNVDMHVCGSWIANDSACWGYDNLEIFL